MSKNIRVLTYPDGRQTLIFNDPPPQNRAVGRGGGRKVKDETTPEFMSVEAYLHTLRRWYREELSCRVIDLNLCRWLTLTIHRNMDWAEFNGKLNAFLATVVRTFTNAEYLRAIEVQDETRRYHAHIIFCFVGAVPTAFTRTWIMQNWTCGICRFDHVYYGQGLFQYLTKNKTHWESDFTSFPYGARVLKKSRGFGKIVEPTESFIPRETGITLTFQSIEKCKARQGHFIRIDDCPCTNQATGEIFRCWNRVYLTENKKIKLKEIKL